MQEAPTRPPVGPSLACPNCGAPVESDQLSCVECGTPLQVARRSPPSWRATAAGVALALLVLGVALGFLLRELTTAEPMRVAAPAPAQTSAAPPAGTTAPLPTEGEKKSTAEPAPDQPLPSGGARESEAPGPSPPPAADPSPRATGNESPGNRAGGGGNVESWPAGESAFTVVLVSSTQRSDAQPEAERAVADGLPAGILRSNEYSSLNPGYWVVYAGQFDSRDEAARRAQSYASQGFPDAYPRRIEPAG